MADHHDHARRPGAAPETPPAPPAPAWPPRPEGEADDDEALAARIAAPLRAPERLAADFEERLLARVRAEARRPARQPAPAPAPNRPAWWRRPRTLRVTPLAGLAAAAAFAGVVCLGTLAASGAAGRRATPSDGDAGAELAAGTRAAPRAGAPAAAPDTVHVVRFVFVDPAARSVALVGDFNAWTREATPMLAAGPEGVWSVSLALPAGRHEYAFIVDGERWVADPFAPASTDDFDTASSVVTVGSARARRS